MLEDYLLALALLGVYGLMGLAMLVGPVYLHFLLKERRERVARRRTGHRTTVRKRVA